MAGIGAKASPACPVSIASRVAATTAMPSLFTIHQRRLWAERPPRSNRGMPDCGAPTLRAPQQKFTVSHHDEQDFRSGLRRYAKYRDLGISSATGGIVQAHVIRFVPPSRPEEVAKRHYHDVDFQMVYVLKGWLRSEFEGQGEVLLRTGAC